MLCNDSGNTAQKNGDRGKRNHDRALATPAYTELPTSMARQRQLASSTKGSRVHATCWSPAEPTTATSHSNSLSRGVGPKQLLDSSTPATGTKGDGG